MTGVYLTYRKTKDCRGHTYKKYAPCPSCGKCHVLCGFYSKTCPHCGATLDRTHVLRIERCRP